MTALLNFWTRQLKTDLTGFADPGTEVEISGSGNEIETTWEQRGRARKERFRLSQAGDFRWLSEGSESLPYPDFLTSPAMADFDQLAAAMCRAFPSRSDFVPTNARMEAPDGEEFELTAAPDDLRARVIGARRSAEGRTGLFFIKGEAGAGKTTLLHELTASQAARHAKGDSKFLFFFVSAQGRALSNLRDAFSGELQDLRAGFTRDAVPALARAGVLVPVIDGFDELLGAAGYGDAFSSLRQFLVELGGQGVVLVSARSAFYNVEFISRAPEVIDANLSLQPVSLLPWSNDQLMEYLTRRREKGGSEVDRRAVGELDQRDRRLLSKPFFASRFPEFVDSTDGDDAFAGGLLDFLIEAYIAREAGKMLGASGDPILSTDGHRQLLEEAAELMWQSEKRQLGSEELQTLVEMIAEEEGLAGDESRQLITKVTSSAGFRTNTPTGSAQFTFDHEVYFEYFLGRALERQFGTESLGSFFDRGVLPEDVVESAVSAVASTDVVEEAISTTSAALRHENRRRNAGAVIVARANLAGPITGGVIQNVSFINLIFGDASFRDVVFDNCEFTGSRLDNTTFEDCDATTSRFQAVVVTNNTKFGVKGIVPGANFGSLIHPDVGAEVFSPQEVGKILRRLNAPLPGTTGETITYAAKAKVLIKLLQLMARGYRRANVLFDTDQHLHRLFSNEHWPDLRNELIEHGVVREETRDASGPKARVYRLLVGLDDLLSAENRAELPKDAVGEFWGSLRSM